MIKLKRILDLFLIFSNSLLMGVFIALIFVPSLILTHYLLNLMRPLGQWSFFCLSALVVSMVIGTALILTFRHFVETKGKSSDPNRFRRVHLRFYRWQGSFTDEELVDILSKNGYREIKIESDHLNEVVRACYPWGIFEFPKENGGLRKYEDKDLKIVIDSSEKILKLYMGPKKWFIPTAVVHSNYFFLDRLENILQTRFKLEIIEMKTNVQDSQSRSNSSRG